MGLDGDLAGEGNRIVGILNGIDPDVSISSNDPALAASLPSRDAPAAKAACRADLLTRDEFDPDDDGVVLGMIGRMDPQKGFDLLARREPETCSRRGANRASRAAATPPSPTRSGPWPPRPRASSRADRTVRSRHGPPIYRAWTCS